MPDQDLQRLTFAIDGELAQDELYAAIEDIVVDSSMRMPSMCQITLNDDMSLKIIASDKFQIGALLEVMSGEDGSGETLFNGEVTAIEPDFEGGGRALLVIYAYDKSHRLHRGKHSRTFLAQTDKKIVEKMVAEADLTLNMVDTGVTHDFMLQNNQTNMEWILMRAEQLDYQFFVDVEEKLHFVPARQTRGSLPDLVWGDNLITFRPRLTTSNQVDKVILYGWDQLNKKEIKGEATPNGLDKPAKISKTGTEFAKSFGAATSVIVSEPVQDVNSANKRAEGMAHALQGEFAYAEGTCYGNDKMVVGGKVNIKLTKEALTKFSGQYKLSSVRHVYRVSTGQWKTHFAISGRRTDSLGALLNSTPSAESRNNGRIHGVVPALVTNFNDPKKVGRVKVKYPWLWNLSGSSPIEIESDWVRIATPSAGADRGFYYMPEVDDEVLVAFEHGDPNRPYIVGGLWNSKDKPPMPSDKVHDGSKITKRMIKSRSGHTILLDDTNGSEQIVIRDKSEKNEIVIDTKNNTITIKSEKDINLDAGGNINLKAKGAVNIESTSDTTIASKAAFKVEGKAGNEIKGARLNVDVQGPLNLKTSAIAEMKATVVKIDASALAEVKGGIIKLN
jgi:phage protein D/phage baseplate assembly protein gpV